MYNADEDKCVKFGLISLFGVTARKSFPEIVVEV